MRTRAFLAVIALLGLVPLGLAGWGELQVRGGEHVLLEVRPVDPLDLFRGEYVALSYPISFLPIVNGSAEAGDTVYIRLVPDGRGGWTGTYATRRRPSNGLFIRGRLESEPFSGRARIHYGIESFYVEQGRAREYQQAMSLHALYAEVAVHDDGAAKLVRLVVRR